MRHPIFCLRIPSALLLMFVSVVSLLPAHWTELTWSLILHEWVLLLAVTASGTVILLSRGELSKSAWRELFLWNGLLITIAVLFMFGHFKNFLLWSLLIGLRVVVIGAWVFVVLSIILLYLRIKQARRSPEIKRFSPGKLGRWCFATALTLSLLESSCLLLEHVHHLAQASIRQQPLELPRNLPDPPKGEWHLAAIGGSTILGWPYDPFVSIPELAAWSLKQRESSNLNEEASSRKGDTTLQSQKIAPIVVQNLGVAGVNFPLAVRELSRLKYRPHCLLVYSGHNEFYHEMEELAHEVIGPTLPLDCWWNCSPTVRVLNRLLVTHFSSVWQLTGYQRRLIDRPLGSQRLLEERLQRFRSRLEELAIYCNANKIVTIWFVPAASESGFDPNRSVLPQGVSQHKAAILRRLYQRARSLELQGDHTAATEQYRSGVRDFPGFAELHYRLGQCLLHNGEYAEAQHHFALAIECDAHPVRMQSPYLQAVVDIAEKYGIVTINADSVLRPHTPHGILEQSLFLDDVHPTLKGISLLANSAALELAPHYESFFDLPHAEVKPVPVRDIYTTFELSPIKLAEIYSTLAQGLDLRSALRFDPAWRNQEAARFREIARQLRKGEVQPEETGIEMFDQSQQANPIQHIEQ